MCSYFSNLIPGASENARFSPLNPAFIARHTGLYRDHAEEASLAYAALDVRIVSSHNVRSILRKLVTLRCLYILLVKITCLNATVCRKLYYGKNIALYFVSWDDLSIRTDSIRTIVITYTCIFQYKYPLQMNNFTIIFPISLYTYTIYAIEIT